MAAVDTVYEALLELGCGEQLVKVDVDLVAHALEHVHQILGRCVAGSAGSKRTAAEAAEGGLHLVDAAFDSSEGVYKTHAAGIVDVYLPFAVGKTLCACLAKSADLSGICDADGVGKVHGAHTRVVQTLSKVKNLLVRGDTLKRAAESGGHADCKGEVGEDIADALELGMLRMPAL